MQILRTIIFLVLAWAVFRFLDRWTATRRAFREQMNSQRPNRPQGQQRTERKEQDIIISYDPRQTKSKLRDDVGEEVDYEEVED